LTLIAAATFRIAERGMVRPATGADLAIFDPDKVASMPLSAIRIISHRFGYVFGEWNSCREDDAHTKARPGKRCATSPDPLLILFETNICWSSINRQA